MVPMFAIGHVLRDVMSARKVDRDTLNDEIPIPRRDTLVGGRSAMAAPRPWRSGKPGATLAIR